MARGITTDSPAATRKIVLMMKALRAGGVRPTVVSLGRGRHDASGRDFSAFAERVDGIPIAYGRFVQRPVLSQFYSIIAPFAILWSRRRHARTTTLVIYNRMFGHIPALWFARLLGFRTMLDLEDGEISADGGLSWRSRVLIVATDSAITQGALLACKALANNTRVRPASPYYGIVDADGQSRDFAEPIIHALIGGTVAQSTGAGLLISAIEALRHEASHISKQLHLHVSGSGDQIEAFRRLANDPRGPRITVHGRLTERDYNALLDQCSIGLALKPNQGALADTTFPSKVTEFAGAGLLVLTTDISDVRAVLGDEGAVYLTNDDPMLLYKLLLEILQDRTRSAQIAREGQERARQRCARSAAASFLAGFITGAHL